MHQNRAMHSWTRHAGQFDDAVEIAWDRLARGYTAGSVISYIEAYGFGLLIAEAAVRLMME